MKLLKYLLSAMFILIFGTLMIVVVYATFIFNLPSIVIENVNEIEKRGRK